MGSDGSVAVDDDDAALSVSTAVTIRQISHHYACVASGQPPPSLERKLFHALILLFALFETSACADDLRHRQLYTKPSYGLHIAALWLQVVAVSLVVMLWASALSRNRWRNPLIKLLVALDALLGGYSLGTIGVIGNAASVGDFTNAPAYFWFGVIASAVLLLYTSVLLTYGSRLQLKLRANTRWEQTVRHKRFKILCRMNTVLAVCTLCFTMRVALVVALLSEKRAGGGGARHSAFVSYFDARPALWFLLTEWIPGLCPSVVLLYMMRQPRARAVSGGTTSLLGTPTIASDRSFHQSFINSPSWGNRAADNDDRGSFNFGAQAGDGAGGLRPHVVRSSSEH
eukprot:g3116.t1